MTAKNGDMPAMPLPLGDETAAGHDGLTKREMFCLHMGVAETGDAELDAIIKEGNRQKIAMAAMQGILSNGNGMIQSSPMSGWSWCNSDEALLAKVSAVCADALLAELERTK